MRDRWCLIAVGVALLTADACFTANDAKTCDDFCNLAVRCGLLPSPLGSGDTPEQQEKSCSGRCSLSDDLTYRAVTRCRPASAPGDASQNDLWCASPTPACVALDACLADTFPDADVTGVAGLDIQLASADALATSTTCSTVPPAVVRPLSCTDDTGTFAVRDIALTVAQRAFQRRLSAVACQVAAASTIRVESLHAGLVQVAAEVTASVGGLATPTCRRFENPPVILVAAKRTTAHVDLPGGAATFLAGAPCTNENGTDAGVGASQASALDASSD